MDPADAFALVAHETRIEILEALVAAERENPADPAASFSDLRERVGAENSSRFSYHLSELVGRFVREVDGGYTFTAAGWAVARAVLRGGYAADPDTTTAFDAPCPHCGGALGADDDDGVFVVECRDCERTVSRYFVPPGGLSDRSPGERTRAFDAVVRHDLALAADGVCPACLGPTGGELVRRDGDPVHARYACRRCGNVLTEALPLRLQRHPAVESFFREHGVDPRDIPHWESPAGVDQEVVVVVDQPLQAQVRFEADGELLRLTVGADLSTTVDGVLDAR